MEQITVETMTSLQSLQYNILGHSGLGYTEIRRFGKGSEWCKTEEDFRAKLSDCLNEDVYVSINARRVMVGKMENVSYLSCVVIDIDPIRPRNTPSTDAQHEESLSIGRRIKCDYEGVILVSSGSGCHAYFPIAPIPVTNAEALTESLGEWFKQLRKKYETKTCKIDSIFDLPRVIRVWGSHNTKSNRPCVPIGEVPTSYRFPLTFSQDARPVAKTTTIGANLAPGLDTELQDRFQRLCLSNPIMHKIVNQQTKFESRSEADYAFISCLVRAHFPEQDIRKLMVFNPLGRKEECKNEDIKRIISKICKDGMETISLAYDRESYFTSLKDRKMGLLSGMPQFDEMVSGLKPTKVIVFAARPTEGKTTIATQILTNIALQGKTCLFFPTEVGSEPIYDKILSRRTGVSLKKFQNGAFTQPELDKIEGEREYLSKLPLVVCEDFALRIERIEQKIKEVAPQVVAIDYIQAMDYSECRSAGDVATKMSNNVIRIKELANVHKIPILLFSQLRRGEGKLDLSMLKGCGALEEFTDIIAFLSCNDKFVYPRPVDLVVMKSKYSATGIINLHFFASTCEFKETMLQETK